MVMIARRGLKGVRRRTMLDSLYSQVMDRMWERPAKLFVRLGFTPNQVTSLGLILVAGNCAAYLWHQSSLALGIGLAVAFAADAFDGAVARLRGMSTAFGGYFDAIVDRYQEAIVFLSIAYISGHWLPASLALTGALLTSYGKARVALEMETTNADWPDLLERLERVIIICAVLIADGIAVAAFGLSDIILEGGLWLLAAGANVTALQRVLRARRLLRERDLRAADDGDGDVTV